MEVVPDLDGRHGVTVLLEGTPQSHVDLGDPTYLAFEYVRLFACVLETLPPGRLRVTHPLTVQPGRQRPRTTGSVAEWASRSSSRSMRNSP